MYNILIKEKNAKINKNIIVIKMIKYWFVLKIKIKLENQF